jgi:hypothetical protein
MPSPGRREKLWNASCFDSDGNPAPQPDCNLCHLPVFPGDDWDESHVPVPKALGGKATGVAHRLCNRRHNNLDVTPRVAKAKRQHRKHVGIDGPGLGKKPMRFGRRDALKKTFSNGIVPRETHAQVHMRFLARRYGMERGI